VTRPAFPDGQEDRDPPSGIDNCLCGSRRRERPRRATSRKSKRIQERRQCVFPRRTVFPIPARGIGRLLGFRLPQPLIRARHGLVALEMDKTLHPSLKEPITPWSSPLRKCFPRLTTPPPLHTWIPFHFVRAFTDKVLGDHGMHSVAANRDQILDSLKLHRVCPSLRFLPGERIPRRTPSPPPSLWPKRIMWCRMHLPVQFHQPNRRDKESPCSSPR